MTQTNTTTQRAALAMARALADLIGAFDTNKESAYSEEFWDNAYERDIQESVGKPSDYYAEQALVNAKAALIHYQDVSAYEQAAMIDAALAKAKVQP